MNTIDFKFFVLFLSAMSSMLMTPSCGYAEESNNVVMSAPQPSGKNGAITMLTKLIQADYEARNNGGERIDNIIYTAKTRKVPWQGIDVKPGYYDIGWDEFAVVTHWEILETKEINNKLVKCSIKFHVVGHAKENSPNENITRIERMLGRNDQNKVVQYIIQKKGTEWKVVDPPIPYVGLDPLDVYYQTKLQRLSRQINLMKEKGSAPYPNLLKSYDSAARRLNDIAVIKKSL